MLSFFGIISSENFIQCLEKWTKVLSSIATINKSDPYDIIVDINEDSEFHYEKKIQHIHTYWKFLKPNGIYVLEKVPSQYSFQILLDMYKLHQQYHFKEWIPSKNSIILIKQNEHFE